MPTPILMPALSPTMEEGTLAKWHVKEGDTIQAGDVIAEIETDKATMEVEAVDEGTVGKLLVAEGTEGVKVNAPIALLLAEGEEASALEAVAAEAGGAPRSDPKPAASNGEDAASSPSEPAPKASVADAPKSDAPSGEVPPSDVKATPLARRMAAQAGLDLAALTASAPGGKVGKADVEAGASGSPGGSGGARSQASTQETSEGGRVFASPLACRMARQAGLDLASIAGSGPNSRIVKADIDRAIAQGPGARSPETEKRAPAGAPARSTARGERPFELVKHSNIRKVIAERLTAADRDVPQFYLTVDLEIDRLLDARKEINGALGDEARISVNDLLIKAAALALRKVPAVNAQWSDDGMRMLQTVDVSVAVAIEGGLITPIVFDADRKGLVEISTEMKDLAERARNARLMPEEYQGGSFSISNLGMFGVKQFTAVINPPQASILAVGAGEQRVVVKAGEMAVATVMSCTLTCDHRVVDGALGAQWLKAFRRFVEAPATMLA